MSFWTALCSFFPWTRSRGRGDFLPYNAPFPLSPKDPKPTRPIPIYLPKVKRQEDKLCDDPWNNCLVAAQPPYPFGAIGLGKGGLSPGLL
jgi:hypothetical protein